MHRSDFTVPKQTYEMFRDRLEAGSILAEKLKKYKDDPGIVLAVPRGGVPVAYAVAKDLGFPVDIVLTKKIGHPENEEYAIGAASLTDYFVIADKSVSEEYIEQELLRIRKRLKEMQDRFMGDRKPESLKGKTVIIVDDGIATGNTMIGTVNVLRKSNPGKIVIAVPVAPQSALQKLSKIADDVIAVLTPGQFYGVGGYYEDFEQVTDQQVMYYLDKLREMKKAS